MSKVWLPWEKLDPLVTSFDYITLGSWAQSNLLLYVNIEALF